MFSGGGSKNKSLSAESELRQAYDLLYNGEYKQCLRIIKKKMTKLKSPIDKAFFNILKLRVLRKLKQTKEEKELLNEMIQEFLTNKELYLDDNVSNTFKNVLRSIDESKAAQDIFNVQLKNKDLNTINEKEQKDIFKELTLGFQFKDIYSKCNTFLKQPNLTQEKFLILLKHEAVFYLYKSKKLPEKMTLKVFEDFYKDKEKYKEEKGYFDIIAQFAILFKDEQKLNDLFNEKIEGDLIHVPLDDIKLDKLLNQKKYDEIIKILYNKIKTNPGKCLFNDYERLINLIINYCENNQIKLDQNKIIKEINAENSDKELTSIEKDAPALLKTIMDLFESIKLNPGNEIINSFKSGVLGQLMICYNIIKLNKQFDSEMHTFIKNLIIQLLDKITNKQAILFEISKYFIFLDENNRKELEEKYRPEDVNETKFDKLNSENFSKFLFYMKLRKCLNLDKNAEIKDVIIFLFKAYLFVVKTITKDIKLEKGERNIADDLIILANEYYYEKYEKNKIDVSLALILMSMNIFSRNKSPYNYDISYYLAKTYAYLVMSGDALDTLIYMNLKGPQAESVSYFLFNYFVKYPQGLNYLITHSENWQIENRTNAAKTLWKMFYSGNFWNSEELLDFLNENNNSYYNYLLEFYDIILGLNDAIYNKDGIDEEKEKNHYEVIEKFYEKLNPILNNLIKNQDIFIVLHKYDGNNYQFFENNYELLNVNKNYSENNYRYTLDSLNKKNNSLYNLYPGYRNNYFEHESVSPFGEYDNKNVLLMRLLSILLISKLKINDIKSVTDLNEKYKQLSNDMKNNLDINLSLLIDFYLNCTKDIKYLVENKDKLIELYKDLTQEVITKINELRKEVNYKNYDFIIQINETFYKNKYFYIFLYSNLTSKLQNLISEHKKESNDIANMKAKLNEIFKTPMVNSLRDLQMKLEELVKNKDKDTEASWDFEKDIKNYFTDFTLEEDVTAEFKNLSNKIKVRHGELFEEIKDNSKKVADYIKQII